MSQHAKTERKARPLVCQVVSDSMLKSRVGIVERLVLHPTYKKHLKQTTRIMFHDEKEECKVGDRVLIEPSRPYSARKRFRIVEVIEKAKAEAL
jgi:small subunit ribosomal protein S17